jgi:predicted unusual protein kinase regulating ubiquinone biosynthesis (AarF/ABC1/UbiB family)
VTKSELGERMRSRERPVPVSRLGRWLRSGRNAVGLAGTMLGRRDGVFDLAALEALTARLGDLKGVGMKVGQLVSFIDPSLPPEVRATLAALQRSAAASPFPAVERALRDALGVRADELLATLERAPFSVASIGQVHRARLGAEDVVVKVRHPGIAQALEADFAAARGGVAMANTVLFGMASDAREMIEEARATLLAECDFTAEANHQRTFRRWLTPSRVVVPEVFDAWSTDGVLTTRFEAGSTLEQFLASGPSQAARDAAGVSLFEVMVGGFHQLGLLYADPHPGNFAFRDGQVVVYDFGCVRRFEHRHSVAFSAMARALRLSDRPALMTSARAFGFTVDGAEREALFERFARSFFAPMLVEGRRAIPPESAMEASQLMRDKRALARLGLPPHVLFLLRLRFGLYAVLSTLGAQADWGALEYEWSQRERAPAAGAAAT